MTDKPVDLDADDVVAALGARLRSAREAANISIDEAADDLHLSRNIVLALEEGDFEVLGAPVFVKGHLRSYARLLKLPEHEIAESYKYSIPEPEEFKTLSTQTVLKSGANLSNFFLWVLLLVIILIGSVYLLAGDNEPAVSDFEATDEVDVVLRSGTATIGVEAGRSDQVRIDNVEGAAIGEATDVAEPEVEQESDFAVMEPVPEPEPEPETETETQTEPQPELQPEPLVEAIVAVTPPPTTPVEEQLVQLSLTFTDECWVEISDARRRLLYGLEKKGVQRVLEGQPPFKLFLGNTDVVELKIDGQPYVVPPSLRTGNNTARFAIDAALIAEITGQ